jgi:hypothetical protein
MAQKRATKISAPRYFPVLTEEARRLFRAANRQLICGAGVLAHLLEMLLAFTTSLSHRTGSF